MKRNKTWLLVITFALSALTGIKLHVEIDHNAAWHLWLWIHSLAVLAFTVSVVRHTLRHRAWYHGLKRRTNAVAVIRRRINVLILDAAMSFLFISGIVLIPMSIGTHLGIAHFIAGLVFSTLGVLHLIKRRKGLSI